MAGLGFHPHTAPLFHRVAGKALGASMWFWMMYRIRQDAPVVLGWRHPWDGHGHGHGHEDGHGDAHH